MSVDPRARWAGRSESEVSDLTRGQGISASEPRTRRDARCRWFPWRDETPAAEDRTEEGLGRQIDVAVWRQGTDYEACAGPVAVAVSIGDTAASAAAGGVHADPAGAPFEASHDEDEDAHGHT